MPMQRIKVIKNEHDYNNALEAVKVLLKVDPDPNSEDGEKLALLAHLIEEYENENFVIELPDPIEAIKFRMDQQELKPQDLVPFIGSRSKVSEVLSGKRKLTLTMIRSLEAGLGIPAKVLIQQPVPSDLETLGWELFPVKEIFKRGYIKSVKDDLQSEISNLVSNLGGVNNAVALLKKTEYVRSARSMDQHALIAWASIVAKKAADIKHDNKYVAGTVDLDYMKNLAKCSSLEDGVKKAADELLKKGIILVVEPHFGKTYLDGAALFINGDNPIIGMTIRHDRLDNFWFTLMHELAHIVLHRNNALNFFYDNLDDADVDEREKEADNLAMEALVPEDKWENSPARIVPSPIAAESLANELGIHPAIVAGKMRREKQRYNYLVKLVNEAKVRYLFPEITWNK